MRGEFYAKQMREAIENGAMCVVNMGLPRDERPPFGCPEFGHYGFLHEVNDEQFLMRCLTSRATYDGFAAGKIEFITSAGFNATNLQTMAALYAAREEKHPPFFPDSIESSNFVRVLLEAAQNSGQFVGVYRFLGGSPMIGTVEEVDEDGVVLRCEVDSHHKKGTWAILFEEIDHAICDSLDLQDQLLLHRALPPGW